MRPPTTRAITAALQYARGPLSAFLGYDQLNASRLLSAAQAAATPRAIIGASYDFTALKIAVAYNRVADGWFAGRSFRDGGRVGGLAGTPTYAFSRDCAQFPCHRARRSDGPVGTCVRFMAAH